MNKVIEKPAATGSIIPAARLQQVKELSTFAKRCNSELLEADDHIMRAMIVANGTNRLRQLMTDEIMSDFRALMNTPLGFRTDRPNDKNPQPYGNDILRDSLIQALICGLRPTGNEFNILAGNMYVTKDGYRRLLKEFPGFSELQFRLGTPKAHGDGCLVDCSAQWKMNGKECSMDCTGTYAIPVRRNAAMGIDAVLGKAESKLLRRIYAQLVGSDWAPADTGSIGDDEPGDVIEGTVESQKTAEAQ